MKKTIHILFVGLFLIGSINAFAQQKQEAPKCSIGGKTTGSIKKADLVSAGKINVVVTTKKVTSFMLVIGTTEYSSNSNLLTPEMKTAINAINKPTKITFTKIVAVETNRQNAPNERAEDLKLSVEP